MKLMMHRVVVMPYVGCVHAFGIEDPADKHLCSSFRPALQQRHAQRVCIACIAAGRGRCCLPGTAARHAHVQRCQHGPAAALHGPHSLHGIPLGHQLRFRQGAKLCPARRDLLSSPLQAGNAPDEMPEAPYHTTGMLGAFCATLRSSRGLNLSVRQSWWSAQCCICGYRG